MTRLSTTHLAFAATVAATIFSNFAIASEATWIWGSKKAHQSAPVGECEFQRSVTFDADPQAVIIEVAVDNHFTLRVNNRYVTSSNDVSQTTRIDVTPLIHKGENVFYLLCRNEDGPAGFRGRIVVTDSDGAVTEIGTDENWQAKLQRAGTWDPTIRQRTPWHKPFVLGTSNMEPWASVVKEPTTTDVVKARAKSDGPFELRDGDRVVLLGNTFIERSQRYGFVELALTRRYPDRNVVFRNLGWSGDTVFGEARARFGSVEQGFQHLETQVHLVEPTLILVAYGANAAFTGPSGIEPFIAGYERLLNAIETTGARITLVSPLKHESLGPPLPDQSKYNRDLQLYSRAIRQLAERRSLGFLDLYDPFANRTTGPEFLTDNGMHFTEVGYRYVAEAIEGGLGITRETPKITIESSSLKSSADNAAVSQIEKTDSGIEFTASLASLPLPTLAEANASPAFTLSVRGLAEGEYKVMCGEEALATATSQQIADGVKILQGPDHEQSELLRETIVKKNELFFHRWRPQNETYLFLFRKHEQGNNAVEIPRFDPLVEAEEAKIAVLRTPQPNRYRIASPR
ncbi:MAG: SGNH/GDSL hydrolase family protein [Planctomycetales bacterium]|nr:SGNH/GDSL hydrolase family protein [Planctomycetales bacterium]